MWWGRQPVTTNLPTSTTLAKASCPNGDPQKLWEDAPLKSQVQMWDETEGPRNGSFPSFPPRPATLSTTHLSGGSWDFYVKPLIYLGLFIYSKLLLLYGKC